MFTDFADRPVGGLVYALVRVLAVLDAIAIQCVGMWWLFGLPQHGGVIGATGSAVLVIWALKRAGRAIFDFDNYGWMTVKVGKWVLLLWVFGLVSHLWLRLASH